MAGVKGHHPEKTFHLNPDPPSETPGDNTARRLPLE